MRTDQEIVDETNELAHYLLRMKGYEAAEGAKLYEAEDPRRAEAWLHAVHIMEMITKTEVQDALNNVLTEKVDPHPLDAMRRAESFISGFEGDELQEGIAEMLTGLRSAIAKVEDMWGLLCASSDAWDGEEESVKEEHEELIADLSEFIDGTATPVEGTPAEAYLRSRLAAVEGR